MIAEVMRWCDEQLTIDHNLVPTTPGRRAPLAHLHPDWFTALLLCGKNSLAITKLSSRPYFIKYAFLHFLFTKLKSKASLFEKQCRIRQEEAQCFKISWKVSFYIISSKAQKINSELNLNAKIQIFVESLYKQKKKHDFGAKIQISHFLEILFVLEWFTDKKIK